MVGPVLAVSNLAKSFDGRTVLAGLDFALAPGQSTALIGANGSGKSTLLKCLVRLIEPTGGRIQMLGRDVRALNPRELREFRAEVGFVWQRHNLVPRLSALSNVVHGVQSRLSGPRAWFQALAPAAVRAEAMACLDRVGLADRALMRVDSLSGGQQQRVAIARALMQDPKIILADEPIASLDPMNAQIVMDTLKRINVEDGRMVIANLHTLDTARRYCDRVIGMRDGRIVFDGLPDQLTTAAARDIYGADASFSESATSTSIDALPDDDRYEKALLA